MSVDFWGPGKGQVTPEMAAKAFPDGRVGFWKLELPDFFGGMIGPEMVPLLKTDPSAKKALMHELTLALKQEIEEKFDHIFTVEIRQIGST